MQKIYLDHSATTPLDPQVLKKMQPYLTDIFGNASSVHSFGQEAMKGVDWAREQLSKLFGCKFKEVIFTSGASESNNLALRGLVMAFRKKLEKKYHIITSKIEHPAILETCQALEKEGLVEVSYVGVNKLGLVEVEDIKKAIKDNTILVSVMYVNNETGVIQPIKKIGQMIEKVNKKRLQITDSGLQKNKKSDVFDKIYFHTDAVQAVNYCKMQANYLGADLITISGHKIYGPKGIGALYIKE
ncbi:MAG: cysteine desulfurase family protein, partial [Candidatus Parcubacteria bacterium]|nr:cysteine desulfurase family protein [Candidatus Parcubacteria bacterium]